MAQENAGPVSRPEENAQIDNALIIRRTSGVAKSPTARNQTNTEAALPVQTLGHIQHACEDALFVSIMKNASVQFGQNWLRNSQRSSITVRSKRYGL